MKPDEAPYFEFRGVRIDNLGCEDILGKIVNNLNKKGYICFNDVDNVSLAAEKDDFRIAIKNSLISIADGMPLAWYGRLLGSKKIERIQGPDLFQRLLEQSQQDFKHYLLGDTEETIAKIIKKAKKINPRLKITGHSPPFRGKFTEDDNRFMMGEINRNDPDIIWVSFGGGKQECWMHQTLPLLNRGIMIGVGAAFRYYIGDLTLPPVIIQKMGLQWFFRKLQEPQKKPLINKIKFVYHFPGELIKAYKNAR